MDPVTHVYRSPNPESFISGVWVGGGGGAERGVRGLCQQFHQLGGGGRGGLFKQFGPCHSCVAGYIAVPIQKVSSVGGGGGVQVQRKFVSLQLNHVTEGRGGP